MANFVESHVEELSSRNKWQKLEVLWIKTVRRNVSAINFG
jgi:hypothetical protein